MSFSEAIESGFSKYADFSGRASKAEYWSWVAFVFLAALTLQVVGRLIGVAGLLALAFDIGVFLPGLAVAVRRLHDTGHSAWNLLWAFTIIGAFYLLYLYLKKTQDGTNRYGTPPLRPASSGIAV